MKSINKDINKANTLPGVFYQNKETFNSCKELIFSKTWQLIGEDSNVPLSNNAWPFLFMDGFIDEPLVLVRNKENGHLVFHTLRDFSDHASAHFLS